MQDEPIPQDAAGDEWDEADDEQRLRAELIGAVRLYRQFGLFASHADLSDVEVAEALYGGVAAVLLGSDEPVDALVLAVEQSRAWMSPLDSSAVLGGNLYTRVLELCSTISQGSFVPEQIREDWSDPDEVEVRFSLDGQDREVIADRSEKIDLHVIGQVNGLIQASRRRFVYSLGDFGEGAMFVACFSFEEWERVREERPAFASVFQGEWA